jgi:hypothetical protein
MQAFKHFDISNIVSSYRVLAMKPIGWLAFYELPFDYIAGERVRRVCIVKKGLILH